MASESSVGVQMHVWGRDDEDEEKGTPIPPGKEDFPHIKVLEKFFVETDVVETVVYAPGKVNHTLQESSPGNNSFAGELEGTCK